MNIETIKGNLPHGSGIDADWKIEDKGSYFKCYNSFHLMDETGGYDGWQDFYVIYPKKVSEDIKVHLTGYKVKRKSAYRLKDYLEELFYR